MSFFEDWDKKSEEDKTSFVVIIGLVVFTIIATIYGIYLSIRGRATKSSLAKEYGVSIKVLMKWLKLFGSEEAKNLYIGTIPNIVSRKHFTECLGSPEDYPKDEAGFINTKPKISKAGLVSERTMLRRIKEIENPEVEIGMSLDAYRKLKYFPPKHVNWIIDYLKPYINSKAI